MKVNRNDPCPCGSGKKYKKCCMDKDLENGRQVTQTDIDSAVKAVLGQAYRTISSSRYEQDLENSKEKFFNLAGDEEVVMQLLHNNDLNNYLTWLVCDYQLINERISPMELFLQREESRLPELHRIVARNLADSHIALYSVISVDTEQNLVIFRNLFDFESYEVIDPKLAEFAHDDVLFGLRFIPVEGMIKFVGDIYVYPIHLTEELFEYLKENLVDERSIIPPTIHQLIKRKGYLFNHMQMMVGKENPAIRKKKSRAPQDSRIFVESAIYSARSHFLVDNVDGVREKLDSMSQVSFKRVEDGKFLYSWSKTPSRQILGQEDGIIILGKGKLILETSNPEALEDGKNSIQKALKPMVKYMYDDVERRRVIG